MSIQLIPLHVELYLWTFFGFSDRRTGSSLSSYRKDDYGWRYDGDDLSEDVIRASNALENVHLDRKARNLTSSWRYVCSLLFCDQYSVYWVEMKEHEAR